jgi:hypothetical protein
MPEDTIQLVRDATRQPTSSSNHPCAPTLPSTTTNTSPPSSAGNALMTREPDKRYKDASEIEFTIAAQCSVLATNRSTPQITVETAQDVLRFHYMPARCAVK